MNAKLLPVWILLFLLAQPLFGADAVPSPDEDLERVELAYQQGMAHATTPAERLETAYIRAESLNIMLEISYQASLAWLLDADSCLEQVQRDQAEWATEREAVMEHFSMDDAPAARTLLDKSAEMTRERLEALRLATHSDAARDC